MNVKMLLAAAARLLVVSAGMMCPAASENKDSLRPYEMVRAGRVADDRPPISDLADASEWEVECDNAVASLDTAKDRALFADSVARLTYRATGPKPKVYLVSKKALPVPAGADTISLWVYGNNNFGKPADTPGVAINAFVRGVDGRERQFQFVSVNHKEWFKHIFRLPGYAKDCLKDGGTLVKLMVHGGTNPTDRTIDLASMCLYKDEKKPISFPERAKRGVQIFKDQPQGINTGEGRLPFPNVSTTIIPVAKRDKRIEFKLPEDPLDWDSLAVRIDGGEWMKFAVGGGIFPVEAREGASVKFSRVGNSLVADVVAKGGGVSEVRFGGLKLDGCERIAIPYMTYGFPGPTNRPAVVASRVGGKPFFMSAHFDWTQSNASEPGFCGAITNGIAPANGSVVYTPKTDGKRNDVYERFVWTFSRRFSDTLPNIPNPVSPWKRVTGSKVWAVYGASRSRENDYAYWKKVVNSGFTEILVTDHETMWRDGNESFTFRTEAAPKKGGDEAQRVYTRRMIDELGLVYGPYNNYTDYAPVNANWSEDMVSQAPNSQLKHAWYRCYQPKPVYAVGACERIIPAVQEKFSFNTAYCDVHTATSPWRRTDYDFRSPGAATFSQVFYAFGEIMLLQKRTWAGPVYSEGNMHWLYSGLTDGNYAQDRGYRTFEMPWLVDFDLLRLHPLECNFGMGSLGMFYFDKIPENLEYALDRFLAATIAFGHSGKFVRRSGGLDMHSYFMIQALAAKYTLAKAVNIRYADEDGKLHPTSEALVNGVFRRNQLVVNYDDGTFVAVNGSTNEDFVVEFNRGSMTLPPNGFFAMSGDVKVFSGYKGQSRADLSVSPKYVYLNGRGNFVRFAEGGSDGKIARMAKSGGSETIMTSDAMTVELPYVAKKVFYHGYHQNQSTPIKFEVVDGRTRFKGCKGRCFFTAEK